MTADDEARAVLDYLHAAAAVVIPDSPMPEGAALADRVQSARWTVERRVNLVDHMLDALGVWRGLYDA